MNKLAWSLVGAWMLGSFGCNDDGGRADAVTDASSGADSAVLGRDAATQDGGTPDAATPYEGGATPGTEAGEAGVPDGTAAEASPSAPDGTAADALSAPDGTAADALSAPDGTAADASPSAPDANPGDGSAATEGGGAFTLGTCSFHGACGGSLDGTWDVTQTCVTPVREKLSICDPSDANSYLVGQSATGTLTIAGTTYSHDYRATAQVIYSAACLTRASLATCADVEAALDRSFAQSTSTCNGTGAAGTGCDCSLTVPDLETGSLVTIGGGVQFVPQGETASPRTETAFCVTGTKLEIHTTETSAPDAAAQIVAHSIILATKK